MSEIAVGPRTARKGVVNELVYNMSVNFCPSLRVHFDGGSRGIIHITAATPAIHRTGESGSGSKQHVS